jgi:16S rRNA (guanine966-N2)-methyltransferase
VRVIAGRLGGRRFDSPHTPKTHPMSDKVRGALCNILGDIEDLTVLDAFAGSGAIGFEALSRGAKATTFIDNDRAAQQVIIQNIKALQLEGQTSLIQTSASAWLQTNPAARFDLVICDPPYSDLQPDLLHRLASCLEPDGIFVLSWPSSEAAPVMPRLKKVAHHSYGDAQLIFFAPVS